MAATLIPIIASAASALLPVVPSIVQAVESLFGPKTGQQKLETSVSIAQVIAADLAKAGKIQGIPDTATLATLVQVEVERLKAQGQLPAPVFGAASSLGPGRWLLIIEAVK